MYSFVRGHQMADRAQKLCPVTLVAWRASARDHVEVAWIPQLVRHRRIHVRSIIQVISKLTNDRPHGRHRRIAVHSDPTRPLHAGLNAVRSRETPFEASWAFGSTASWREEKGNCGLLMSGSLFITAHYCKAHSPAVARYSAVDLPSRLRIVPASGSASRVSIP